MELVRTSGRGCRVVLVGEQDHFARRELCTTLQDWTGTITSLITGTRILMHLWVRVMPVPGPDISSCARDSTEQSRSTFSVRRRLRCVLPEHDRVLALVQSSAGPLAWWRDRISVSRCSLSWTAWIHDRSPLERIACGRWVPVHR